MAGSNLMTTVTILLPAYNEEAALPATIRSLERLDHRPGEILLVDGGSTDRTVEIARKAGFTGLSSKKKGRSAQINLGLTAAKGDVFCVLHADGVLPQNATSVIAETRAERKMTQASFAPRFGGKNGMRWGPTFQN